MESEMGYSVETCRVERQNTDPQLAARNHITPSVHDALARQNCTRIVHQTLLRWPDDNPFSLTLPNASVSSYEINQAISEVH